MSITQSALPDSDGDVLNLAVEEPQEESSHGEWTRGIIGVTVSVSNYTFSVRHKRLAQWVLPCFFASEDNHISPTGDPISNRVTLLRDVSMIARPGELTAILGPSGCGKTTLLNAIANRAKGRSETGSIYFNNVRGSKRNLHRALSMVYANDMMLPYLTVFETLMFAATLRLGGITMKEREEACEHVMKELALTRVRDTRVGGVWHKGLSTGELRRLSIAQELISNPAVLLLDEPTSGLDAVLAYEIMYVLRMVAKAGRTVICSIHQPRTAIFELLDNVVLMGRGRTLYCGHPKTAPDYFQRELGLPAHLSPSPAEFLIEVASEVVTPEGGESDEKRDRKVAGDWVSDQHQEVSQEQKQPMCVVMGEHFTKTLEYDTMMADIEAARSQEGATKLRFKVRSSFVQWWLELYAIMYRSFRNTIRNPMSYGTMILIQVIVGIFLGAFFFDMPKKYLPAHRPKDIGDPDSPAMKMFETDVAQFFTTGIDGTGANPLFDLLLEGVDGRGSMPFEDFKDFFLADKWMELPECAHLALNLEKYHKYANTNFTEYRKLWDLEDDEKGVPDYVGQVMRTLQFLDYFLGDTHWQQIYDTAEKHKQRTGSISYAPFYAWPECVGETNEIFQAMAVCSGVYPEVPGAQSERAAIALISLLQSACTLYRNAWLNDTWAILPPMEDPPYVYPYNPKPNTESKSLSRTADVAAREPSSSPTPKRRLQAGALVSSNSADLLAFLPDNALQAIERLGEYSDAMKVCGHPLCHALSSENDGPSVGDYGSVLGAVLNLGGALFFAVANTGFATYDALISFPQERAMYNREIANHMYKIGPYYFGKTLAAMPFQIVPVILQNTAFFFMVKLEPGEHGGKFFKFLGIVLLFSFACYGYGYVISALSPSIEIAVVAAPLILVIFICCSGFFVRDNAVPYWMGWVKIISIYRWGFFALLNNQFPPGGYYWGLPHTFVLALMGITETRIGICLMWIVVLGLITRMLSLLVMKTTYRRVGLGQ